VHRADIPRFCYQVKRPDLMYRWVVDRATDAQLRAHWRIDDDGRYRVGYEFKDALWPRLADYDPSWGAGLFSAEETVQNIADALRAQEAEFAQVAPPPTAPVSRKRVVVA
jgi:hypothetical protein